MTQMSTPALSARTHHSRSSRADTQVSSSQVKLGNQTPNRIVRLPTALLHHLDHRHHAEILMGEDVAVVDELPGEIEERNPNDDAATRRQVHGVLVGEGPRVAVDRHYLEVLYVDVERMSIRAGIAQNPLLGRPELDRGVDDVRVKGCTVDGEYRSDHVLLKDDFPLLGNLHLREVR